MQNKHGETIFIRLKKIMKYQKGKPRWKLENLYDLRGKAKNVVEINLLG